VPPTATFLHLANDEGTVVPLLAGNFIQRNEARLFVVFQREVPSFRRRLALDLAERLSSCTASRTSGALRVAAHQLDCCEVDVVRVSALPVAEAGPSPPSHHAVTSSVVDDVLARSAGSVERR